MKRSTKVVIRSITSILVFVVVFLALSVSVVRFFGFEVYGVLTGSMEPEYPTGSLIYVKKIDTSSLQVGDTISFKLSENVIATHRIVELVPDENNPSVIQYRTKGDANDAADSSLVSREDIIGKVVFCLPKMGYFLNYIQSPTGITTTVLVSLLLIALVFVSELITADGSSKLVWKIRGMITGDHRTPQQARRSQQRQPSPRYEDDYYDDRRRSQQPRRQAPDRRSSDRRYNEADYYEPARSHSRYDDSRRSSRYEDDGYSRSSQSYSRSRYDDSRYGDSRGRYDSRYDDGYSPRSNRAQSAYQPSQRSRYDDDDYYASRRSTGAQSRSAARSSEGSSRQRSASSTRSSSYAHGSSRSARSSYSERSSYSGQGSYSGQRSYSDRSSYSGSSRRSRYEDE